MKADLAIFDPELAEVMGRAFDEAWDALRHPTGPSNSLEVQEALASRIIHMAQRGERELIHLRNDAIVHVRGSILH
jgi:hypothetical protein